MLALSAGSLRSRSDVPTLKRPGPAGRVRLFLTLDEDGQAPYAVDLLDDGGSRLWRSEHLPSTGGLVVIVDAPSRLFEPGQYRMVLRQTGAGGQAETVGTYPFVVARE